MYKSRLYFNYFAFLDYLYFILSLLDVSVGGRVGGKVFTEIRAMSASLAGVMDESELSSPVSSNV